jgi:hypothetical protein
MTIDKEECACGHTDDCTCLHCCRWHGKSTKTPRVLAPDANWWNDAIQIPRFLASLETHADLTTEQLFKVCEAEGVDEDQLQEIFDRASVLWERIQKNYRVAG